MTQRLTRALREYDKKKSDKPNAVSGLLGITLDGNRVVEVPNREGYVFVRLRGSTSELIQAYNSSVSPIYDLPVLVVYEGNRYAISGRDTARYGNWGESSYLPIHGEQHSFAPELGVGGDPAWIYPRQFVALSSVPSGTDGAWNVIVNSYVYRNPSNGSWAYVGDEGTPSLLGMKPTGSSSRLMLLCWDTNANDPVFITGSTFSNTLTGTSQIAQFIPTLNNTALIPISAIVFSSGTPSIGWDNIHDVRQFFSNASPVTGSVGGGGGSGSTIYQDEGVNKGSATILNVVGLIAEVSVSGTVARLEISIPTGTLDARYLKLDTTNDPVSNLSMTGTTNVLGTLSVVRATAGNALYVEEAAEIAQFGANSPLVIYQDAGNDSVLAGVLNIGRFTDPGNTPSYQIPLIDAYSYDEDGSSAEGLLKYDLNGTVRIDMNPSKTGSGTAYLYDTEAILSHHGKLIMLQNGGTPRFWVNASGTAFERGTPLAKESTVFTTFTTVDGKTITVRNGIITNVA